MNLHYQEHGELSNFIVLFVCNNYSVAVILVIRVFLNIYSMLMRTIFTSQDEGKEIRQLASKDGEKENTLTAMKLILNSLPAVVNDM